MIRDGGGVSQFAGQCREVRHADASQGEEGPVVQRGQVVISRD